MHVRPLFEKLELSRILFWFLKMGNIKIKY